MLSAKLNPPGDSHQTSAFDMAMQLPNATISVEHEFDRRPCSVLRNTGGTADGAEADRRQLSGARAGTAEN